MMDNSFKLVLKLQTPLGGFQSILFPASHLIIFGILQRYHANERFDFNCDPKPSDFIRQLCYDSYISTVTKPHGLIPRNVVAITLGVLCACWIGFAIYGVVTLRKRPGCKEKNTKKFLRAYFIHVFFRIFFLGVMLGLVCSYQTIFLPSVFKCGVNDTLQTNSQTTPSPLSQTKLKRQCNDRHHEEKSNLNIAVISVDAFFMVVSILEVLHLYRIREKYVQKLLGNLEDFEVRELLQKKPTITNTEVEVDKDLIVTWSAPEASSSNRSIKYRLECRKQSMTGPTKVFEQGDIVETHLKITGLEYDTEYEVQLFAVNEQGDSEPDVRTFKTKSGLPEKPTITSTEIEVDKYVIVTWSEAEANSGNGSIKYRLECWKQSMTGPTKVFEQGDIVETRHTITGLEYDTEYVVQLFAVNEQGDSKPDVRTFKTKSGLPEKPTITNTETEVDKDLIVTWSEAEVNSSNYSIKYRLEWSKQPMATSTKNFKRGNIVETHLKITGLEYDTEYEVKLFAVNKQGDSEPDVRTFKTKSAVSVYTSALQSSIIGQTEFQPKMFASCTISSPKTDDIFTNLLIQHGRKALIKTYSRSETLKDSGKVSGTPVKHCSDILLGLSKDQGNANSILVVGKAGIGKSLFCQKLIRDWAKNKLFQASEDTEIPNLKFVYLLTFRQLNSLEKHLTLREILNCCSTLDDKCNIDDSTFEYIVKHPKEVMIILDGYDEYSQQEYIAGNLQQHPNDARSKMPVAALCSKLIKGKILKGAIVMITSRPDESDKMGGFDFKRYVEIAGFSSVQVKEFIERYFEKDENVKNAVLKHVMNNKNLVSLAHIPMLCYLLCFEMEYTLAGSQNPDDLPVSTTEIYTKLVDIFELRHNAESKYRQEQIPEKFKHPPVIKNKPPSGIKETLDKLSKLAAKLLVEGKPTFDESEIEGNLEAEEVAHLKGSGLLYCGQPFRTAPTTTTKHFSFTHLTVQEFLAARWFVKENCVPGGECSEMVFQFMAGVLSNEGNEELMEKLLDSPFMHRDRKMTCLNEYQNKEFAKKFIRNNPQAFCDSDGVMAFERFSDVDCIGLSFVLDIISELNQEEAGEAQHKCSDKFVTVQKLELRRSLLTLSGIQRVCNSLNNEHCLVSELNLSYVYLTDEHVDVINRLVVRKLTTLNVQSSKITDTDVASLCEALQDPSCKLTTLNLESSRITDTGVASLCEALQHPSCKLTTLKLKRLEITDSGVTSLCEALQHPSCKLTTLDLWCSSTTDFGAASLCESLLHPSCKLTTLNLECDEMLDSGVASLCEALQHPSCKLTTLNLESKRITDTGVASLCEALQHPSCKLTTLHLESSKITDTGVASLCEALQHPSCKLTTLNLNCSKLIGRGFARIYKDLTFGPLAAGLTLESGKITDTGVASVCKALQHPSCKLTTLNLEGGSITDIGVASLCEALQHPSFKLTTLNLHLFLSSENHAILNTIAQRHRPALNLSFADNMLTK